jgi:hypothetical protein
MECLMECIMECVMECRGLKWSGVEGPNYGLYG